MCRASLCRSTISEIRDNNVERFLALHHKCFDINAWSKIPSKQKRERISQNFRSDVKKLSEHFPRGPIAKRTNSQIKIITTSKLVHNLLCLRWLLVQVRRYHHDEAYFPSPVSSPAMKRRTVVSVKTFPPVMIYVSL